MPPRSRQPASPHKSGVWRHKRDIRGSSEASQIAYESGIDDGERFSPTIGRDGPARIEKDQPQAVDGARITVGKCRRKGQEKFVYAPESAEDFLRYATASDHGILLLDHRPQHPQW